MKRGIITIDTNGTVIIPTTPVWMTLSEIADMFGVYPYDVRKIMRSIFKHGELAEAETQRCIKLNDKVSFDAYSLELIVAIAFRINSRESQVFRRFVTGRLQDAATRSSTSVWLSLGDWRTQLTFFPN